MICVLTYLRHKHIKMEVYKEQTYAQKPAQFSGERDQSPICDHGWLRFVIKIISHNAKLYES